MDTFSIRPYCEVTDFDIIYDFHCDYASKTLAYQLSGASPYIPKEKFRDALKNTCKYSRYPFVVADDGNHPIGISKVEPYVRVENIILFTSNFGRKLSLQSKFWLKQCKILPRAGLIKWLSAKLKDVIKNLLRRVKSLDYSKLGVFLNTFVMKGSYILNTLLSLREA